MPITSCVCEAKPRGEPRVKWPTVSHFVPTRPLKSPGARLTVGASVDTQVQQSLKLAEQLRGGFEEGYVCVHCCGETLVLS